MPKDDTEENSDDTDSLPTSKKAIEAVIDHYQKTYELTYSLWQQRNRTFLILISVIALASLLTFRVPQMEPLLLDIIVKLLGINESKRAVELQSAFPFGIIQSVILVIVFYLMVNLNHRASYILRNYRYLSALEKEIKAQLGLSPESVAFTREGDFYWKNPPRLRAWVPWVYLGVLGVPLIAFLIGRVAQDFYSGNHVFGLLDLAIAVPTAIFFADYAYSSIRDDSATVINTGI